MEEPKQTAPEAESSSGSHEQQKPESPEPKVEVKEQEKGFNISVVYEKSCEGLLVHILEALEDLGIVLLQARVSCSDSFKLKAFGAYENEERADDEQVGAEEVSQAIIQAIKNWDEN